MLNGNTKTDWRNKINPLGKNFSTHDKLQRGNDQLYRQRGETQKAIACFKFVLDVAPFGEIGEAANKNLMEIRGY
ncbi:MAG: hypothetical protein HQK77_19525 [Desulfobacterales bacterium]|nr:hypothetical protein [Desulfobacterales bacterium]